ncbi:MAG: protein kinase [Gemmatimonadaceae bacterium]
MALYPEVGNVLAERYALLREIGRGGMAVVYLASDRKHDREVAVKVLLPQAAAAIGAERFAREISVVAKLQHPHILPLFDSGDAGENLFFVMPFVDGESLRQRLTRERSTPLAQAVRITRQIADALDYAHSRGVVHRDVKPENIMLSGGQALLADFGVARALTDVAGDTLTALGVTLGTPTYMSPEQACAERNLDARSDLYSLACVFYEMLNGSPPFTGETAARVMSQHITRVPDPLRAQDEQLGDGVVSAVGRALAKDPSERFQSVGAFVAELEDAMAAARATTTADEQLRRKQQLRDERKKVFVLDFANISGAHEIEWLSTGIAETIGVDLNKVGSLKVVGTDRATRSRVASRGTGSSDQDRALEIGRSLGARWVVWGGFQKAGSRIRLTPHFGDTESGQTIRAEKIDGEMDDIFTMQDQIVTRLTTALGIILTTDEKQQIARPETTNLSAYEHQAKGQRAFQLFGKESARIAAEHFRAAIAIDPNYALAWAGLGSLLMPKYIASGRREDLDEGLAALERALELEPSLSEPYAFLAYMYLRRGQHDQAIAAARSAVDREPSAHMAWYLLGTSLVGRALEKGTLGDLPLAVRPLLRARATNRGFHPAQMVLGEVYTLRGQYGHAVPLIDEAMDTERSGVGLIFIGSYIQRAFIHLNTGEYEAAEKLLRVALDRYPGMDHVYAETMTAFAHQVLGMLNLRRGELGKAREEFTHCIGLAEGNPLRLGIGAHWVKAHCGLASLHHLQGDRNSAIASLAAGQEKMQSGRKVVGSWIIGSSEAQNHYEIAAACATIGDIVSAIESLRRAALLGWSDLNQLNHDPAFSDLRESPDVRALAAQAASVVTLPPPVGSGGLPDFM